MELVLLVLSLLFFVCILTDKVGDRFGVPALLLFLLVGMLFGDTGLGWVRFDDYRFSEAFATCALCVILFSGGMDTKIKDIRPVIGAGLTLATVGVLLTAVITGVLIWLIFRWTQPTIELGLMTALLMGATMSSTDSASVFSILRSKGVSLKHNLRPLLELESGSNDPMAFVLTTALIGVCQAGGQPNVLALLGTIIIQLVIGTFAGWALGKGMVWLMKKVNISNPSLYPIWVLAACVFIFSVTHFIYGNSFLAVYVGGLVMGNSKVAYRRSTMSFFDGLTWLFQLCLFLMLGLLVDIHQLFDVLVPGLIVSFVMIVFSRPISVWLSLMPFRQYDRKDKWFVGWVGLRGAVPIVFGIMCMQEGVAGGETIFNIIFVCTLISLIVQGTTLPFAANLFKLSEQEKKVERPKNFDIDLPEEIKSVATEIEITTEMLTQGNRLMELGLPDKTLVIMIKRGNSFFVPAGKSILMNGDKLLVITDNEQTLQETYQTIEQTKLPHIARDSWSLIREFIAMQRENRRVRKQNKQH